MFFCSLVILLLASVQIHSLGNEKILLIRQGVPPPQPPLGKATAPQWAEIKQRVNHFDPTDVRTWTMRYLKNDVFFKEGGPIFIYIGGEWAITEGWLMSGLMYDMAEKHNGFMFYTEHRYYGRSYPTEDLSTNNLKYLSADQALLDLVYFIEYQKQNVAGLANSSVLVVGGSYSATLASFGRLKYPHIIDIGYSSSAPLFAKADFTEYYEVVSENLRLASPTCPTIVENAIKEINRLLETPEGSATVSEMFNTCTILNGTAEPERSYFFSQITTPFASVTQYAKDGDLDALCTKIESYGGTDLEKLASFVKSQFSSDCISSYKYFVEFYSNETISDDVYRQWLYQTCTEFGWYQTKAFGDSSKVEKDYNACKDLYGEEHGQETVDNGIERTNLVYGGYEPELSRLISVHGTVDPWHPMGIYKDLHQYAPAILVNGTSHCQDLYSIKDTDSEEMKQTKTTVMNTISKWLDEINGIETDETTILPTTSTTTTTTTTIPTSSSTTTTTTTTTAATDSTTPQTNNKATNVEISKVLLILFFTIVTSMLLV